MQSLQSSEKSKRIKWDFLKMANILNIVSRVLSKKAGDIWSNRGLWIRGPRSLLKEQNMSTGFEIYNSKVCRSSSSIQECKL